MARAAVALGSNLGDRIEHLRSALTGLRRIGEVAAVSSLYETEPVGGPRQGRYLNAVVLLDTDLSPEDLLVALHGIEGDASRERAVRWGPRTLDLDLIVYDDLTVESSTLSLPHPRAHRRRFVLDPLVDVAPDAVLGDGQPASQARRDMGSQRITRWEGHWPTEAPRMGRAARWWVAGQFGLLVVWAAVTVVTGHIRLSPLAAVGTLLAAGGAVIGVAAWKAFGPRITPSPQPRPDAHLVSHGIYRFVRHPMYTAVMLVTFGLSVAFESAAGALVSLLIGAYLWWKSQAEERALALGVPGYVAYRDQVPHRFVPGLW